jgi:hypothetical protein
MRTRLSLALLLSAASPAYSFNELFQGIDPAWVQAQEAMREHRLEQARKRRAEGPRLKPLGDLVKPHRVHRQDFDCIYSRVADWLGADPAAAGKRPAVYHASRTLLHDYAAWLYAEHGPAIGHPKTISTTYLPRGNVIFLDDEAVEYRAARTIDDALAGLFVMDLERRAGKEFLSPETKAKVSEIERRFNAEYSSKGLSACPPSAFGSGASEAAPR